MGVLVERVSGRLSEKRFSVKVLISINSHTALPPPPLNYGFPVPIKATRQAYGVSLPLYIHLVWFEAQIDR